MCIVGQMFEHMFLWSFPRFLRTVSWTDIRNAIDIKIGRSFGATDAIGPNHLISLFFLALRRD